MKQKQTAGASAGGIEAHRRAYGICQSLHSFDAHIAAVSAALTAAAVFCESDLPGIKKSFEEAGGFAKQPYGKGLGALVDAHGKWAKGAAKDLSSLLSSAQALAKTRDGLPSAGAFAQVQIQNGGREKPEDHAQLHQALSFMEDPAAIDAYLKEHSSVWGVVAGWRWLSEGDKNVDETFLYAHGGRKSASVRVATLHKDGEGKTRPVLVPALNGKLSEAEAQELYDWAYWGRE